jgi:hypothetical protein
MKLVKSLLWDPRKNCRTPSAADSQLFPETIRRELGTEQLIYSKCPKMGKKPSAPVVPQTAVNQVTFFVLYLYFYFTLLVKLTCPAISKVK